tara:strand:+ start:320 stop:703 length:384 start_codon:yes stop_codon:yes gene_type:complete
MRKIKYRAWNGEKVIYDLVLNFDGVDEAVWLDGSLSGTEPNAWQEEGLMQFTGLVDKNGKDIYEGDIVNHPLCRSYVTVTWRNACFCIRGSRGGISDLYDDAPTTRYSWEVVGNIYENKELEYKDKL